MNFLGDDIKVNDSNELIINPGSGDFSTASGIDCLVQDIREELSFPLLDDPDHPDRGNVLMKSIHSPTSAGKLEKMEMKIDIKRIIHKDPRVKTGSCQVSIQHHISETFAEVSFETITGKKVENLVVPIASEVQL